MRSHSGDRIVNALSVDLEEWYHPELVKDHLGDVPLEKRAGKIVRKLLDLLDKYGHRSTFFLLSDTVRAYAGLVKEIVERGHEIGFHGHTHKTLYEHTPESFDAEIKAFLEVLRDSGIACRPKGYRAPTFSLNESTSWVLKVLEDNGFLYDSSIFPAACRLYGVSGAPLGIYRPDPADIRKARDSGILEFPLGVAKVGSARIPASGGAYFRLLPFFLGRWLLGTINREGRPFVFYFHPWEMDPGIPRLSIGRLNSFMTYHGVNGMADKIEKLFQDFSFDRIDELLGI